MKPVAGADAILIEHALTPEECERLIAQAERAGFSEFDAGKNTHAALQVCVHEALEAAACARISRHVPREVDTSRYAHLLNQRWRFYRYAADGKQEFRPHVDAGFPPSVLMETHWSWTRTMGGTNRGTRLSSTSTTTSRAARRASTWRMIQKSTSSRRRALVY